MNSASTIIASNNAPIEAYEISNNEPPLYSSSSINSSPKNNYNLNSISTASIQPETTQPPSQQQQQPYTVVDDSSNNNFKYDNNNYNSSISNDTPYEPASLTATQIETNISNTIATPTKSIIRSNSIRNVNDTIDDSYYNEPLTNSSISYNEPIAMQQPTSQAPVSGKRKTKYN